MTEASSETLNKQVRAGLPAKITVIVFWGLIWGGVVFSLYILKDIEQQLSDRYYSSSQHFIYGVKHRFKTEPNASLTQLRPVLNKLFEKHQLSGVKIIQGQETYERGETGSSMYANTSEIFFPQSNENTSADRVSISAYHTNLKDAVFNARKDFFISMGAVLLLYGFLLVWILKRILTKPFVSMISTAQVVSNGDTSARFDEDRHDEFGYLAKFVNKVMDQLFIKQNELFEEKERAEITLHSIGDAVIVTDNAGLITYLNPVAQHLTGWNQHKIINQPIVDIMQLRDDKTDEPLINPVTTCLQSGKVINVAGNAVLIRDGDDRVAITETASPIRDHSNTIIGAVLVFQDVGEARSLQHQLTYQASHDALTGLYNRREFETQMENAFMEARRDNSEHAMCYLDLDQFKIVNDTCGHVAGDELLQQLSSLLQSHMRKSDVLARLGGDEFGIIFKYCIIEQAAKSAHKLADVVRNYRFIWQEHCFEVRASIGLVSINNESKSLVEILTAADVSCYAAKDAGRDRIHVYAPDDEELKQRHGEMQWVPRIKQALEQNQFILYHQIIDPIGHPSTQCKRFEVLVRMLDSDGQIIPPMAFIPAAERYDLMVDIDRWVIHDAFKTISSQNTKQGELICSINLSGQSLCNFEFLDEILNEFKETRIDPGLICFEITETAAIANLNNAIKFIDILKETGCHFSLDDFGSGLSSFAYLKNLKVDLLKIDGCFVKTMVEDPINYAMIESINQIGHVMDIQTVAEFVENEEIIAALNDIGVDFAQGYGIHVPEPLVNFFSDSGPNISRNTS